MTMKELQQFAKDHSLEVQGRSKAAYYDNLCAQLQKGPRRSARLQAAPKPARGPLPVTIKMTRKELEKFAEEHALAIDGKTKQIYFDNLRAAWEKH